MGWKRTFCDDAFHADQVAKVTGGNGPRGDMFSSKAPLKSNMEVFILFAVCIVHC